MEKGLTLWNTTKEKLKSVIESVQFLQTIEPITEVYKIENNNIYLVVPEALVRLRLQKFYLKTMNEVLNSVNGGEKMQFKFITEDEVKEEKAQEDQIISPEVSKSVIRRNLRAEYTFDNFVTGENNRYAFITALKAAESPYEVVNPLYIFGDVGLGKTHLMTAIGNYILDKNVNANVIYTTAQQFTEDYFRASSKKSPDKFESFYNYYRSADILLVDDIQFLSGKNGTQEEFFKLFEFLYEKNKQMVITSDRPANELENIMARLKSRFSWGLLVDIKKPDFEHRKMILKKKIDFIVSVPSRVSDEVVDYIALNFDENVRTLEGALRRLISYCDTFRCPIDLETAEQVLDPLIAKDKNSVTPTSSSKVEKIKQVVANYYNISVEDLTGTSKKKEFAWARQVAMYLVRTQLNLQLKTVGSFFGGRDHTTVLNAENKINALIKEDWAVKSDIDLLCQKLEK